MTTSTTITKTTIMAAIKYENAEQLDALTEYLNVGRYAQGLQACNYWIAVGAIVSRIKAAKLEGKLEDNVNVFLGCEISANERTFSVKLFDAEKGVREWYVAEKCNKHNPRTIYQAYDLFKNPITPKTEEEKAAEKAEKEKEEAEKSVDFAAVSQALINARNMLKKAKEQKTVQAKEIGLLKKLTAEIEALLK